MWCRNILDITIPELVEKEIQQNNLVNSQKEIPIVHNFNSFSHFCLKERYSKGIILFPNKLRDLNRFPIKVAAIDFFPTLRLSRNATGHFINHWQKQ